MYIKSHSANMENMLYSGVILKNELKKLVGALKTSRGYLEIKIIWGAYF